MTIDRITNRFYVTWADDRNGQYNALGTSVKTNGDAILVASNDGTIWNRQVVIGSSQDEVFPAVAAWGGFVAVTFYTRHYDPNGINLDYGYARLFDFGTGQMKKDIKGTFIKRITTQCENPQVQFVGFSIKFGLPLYYKRKAIHPRFKTGVFWLVHCKRKIN